MNNSPLVSIVIPVYNGANYMREAIDSALAQTYENCEVIVVNDGSTDNSEEIALSYGDKIRYFAKENGGVSTALNLAIEKMRGEYFSWLSHDDVYYPYKVKIQMDALRDCGDMTKIVWGCYDYIDEKSVLVKHKRFNDITDELLATDSIYPVIRGYTSGCTLLIHKSHFERVGLFKQELRHIQDYDMWYRMFYGQRSTFVRPPLYMLRHHGEQDSKKKADAARIEVSNFYFNLIHSAICDEAGRVFGSPYAFYHYMYATMLCSYYMEVAKAALEPLRGESASRYRFQCREAINSLFNKTTRGITRRLCIFCAGVYGLRTYGALHAIDVIVDIFADNDVSKQEKTVVDDVDCISFDALAEIKNDTLVIVANKQSDTVVKQLKSAGFPFVIEKQDVDKVLGL